MSGWREISNEQNLELSRKLLEQQGVINDLKAEVRRLDHIEAHANAVEEENERLHELFDDSRQGDGHDLCLAALAELRPAAAAEEWHREYGRVLVRVMRERDEAGRERDACRTELAEARLVVDAARQWVLAWHSLPDDPDPVVLSALFRRERDFITAVGELDPVRMVSAIGLDELEHRLGPRIAALADEHSARVAVDKRVLDAAEALLDIERRRSPATEDSSIWLEAHAAALGELVAAVDARRALTGEQKEGAATQRYEEARAAGLSDYEAREDGWPTA